MSSTPLPTQLILLSSLPTCPSGTKVRFLGCITAYDTLTGALKLQHAYPACPNNPTNKACPTTAVVDVNLLLSTLKWRDIQVGGWVNVIGYVQDLGKGKIKGRGSAVGVQALMLWSAGAVRLAEYEKAVEMRAGGNVIVGRGGG